MIGKEYIGDYSVYATLDRDGIVLTTENGSPDDPQNTIFLVPEAMEKLLDYWKRVQNMNATQI